MTHTNPRSPQGTTANAPNPYRAEPSAAGNPRVSNFSDAVIAAYIHDISARHRPPRVRKGRAGV